jgi:hypothetical protein
MLLSFLSCRFLCNTVATVHGDTKRNAGSDGNERLNENGV